AGAAVVEGCGACALSGDCARAMAAARVSVSAEQAASVVEGGGRSVMPVSWRTRYDGDMQRRGTGKRALYRHPQGVTAIDAEYLYPGHAAEHLIVDEGKAAFVDVGTNSSVPCLLGALDELGIARTAVDYLLLTHVHLDHAGGAGALMRELPNARALLHPRG